MTFSPRYRARMQRAITELIHDHDRCVLALATHIERRGNAWVEAVIR